MRKIVRRIIIVALLAAIGISGYELSIISAQYLSEAQVKEEMQRFRPPLDVYDLDPETDLTSSTEDVKASALYLHPFDVEQFARKSREAIRNMQTLINEDVLGWLYIPNTRIDYPLLVSGDNSYYLHKDIYHNDASAGSIFMDYRCDPALKSFNTIMYGHNMKNGSMFTDLRAFADPWFFATNPSGVLILKDVAYRLQPFAYLIVSAEDEVIYNPQGNKERFLAYAASVASIYKDPLPGYNIVTLSTCTAAGSGFRIVVLASLIPLY
ncbi:MAG: class B sortase [Symbiobacteriaceae bacterium]|nr:class B sortase [Symbiobacteriaceae bacterium]